MTRVARGAIAALAVAVTATAAVAHHSFAMFDQSKIVTLQGTVRDFRWTNPHVFIQLLIKNADGTETEWSIEMTSPEHLVRVGWKPGTLKAGDKVTLNIHPMHDGSSAGQYVSGTGPDGPLIGAPTPSQGQDK
jgi:Family of unknown function (DUF6152)